jgi:ParB/RepB/Spo0J family partition protein
MQRKKTESTADGSSVEPRKPRTPSIDGGEVVMLPLEELDGQDTTYLFRATVRVGDLQRSLREEGQQIPIIVRRTQGKKKYQIISGFRRTKAAAQLRWKEISAIVRSGLTDDEAFRASVLENTARKTYSDVDRAYIIKAYKDRGHGGEEVAKIMGLTDRQVRNLASLLELPETVQAAIDDPEQHFSTTHALTLKKLKGIYPRLDYRKWVAGVNGEQLSVSQLKRRVTAEYKGRQESSFESIFQSKGTDLRRGEFRFAPVKLVLSEMSDEGKAKLKGELEALLGKL